MSFDTQRLEDYPDYPQGSGSGYEENILPKGAILQSRYEIHKVLGVGGMGAVYLAQDLRFTGIIRWCALKEMISSTPDPHVRRLAVQSFMREANLLVQLRHPGIPQIYDFFTESVRSYLVMEYVEGQNLDEVLENTAGMLKEDQVLDWAIQISDVLIYLHSQDPPIVFRDMKPSNIMLRENDKVALIDFGIAKAFESGQKGTMIGTEGYSPPEQYKGVADPRGDVYALGATLHHLLTKRDPRLEPPFTFHEERPRLLNPALSDVTDAVVMKALEYEPGKRFPSASAFRDALVEALNKQPGTTAAGAAGTQVLTGGDVATTLLPNRQPPAVSPPQQQPYPPAGYPQHQYPPQFSYPPQYPPPGYPPAGPGQFYGGYPATAEGGEEQPVDSILPIWQFKCEDEIRGSVRVAGDTVFVGVYDNNVYAIDSKAGEFRWKYPTDGGIASRPFVYKELVIFGSEDRIAYAVSRSGRLVWTCPTQGRIRSSAVVDFDHAFFGSDDNHLYAVNAQTGRVIWRFEAMGPIRSTPALGHEMVFVGSEDGNVYAVDLSSGSQRWRFRANRGVTSSPTVFEDVVVVGSSDRTVYGLEAKSGYSIWRVRTGQAVISSPVVANGTVYIGSVDKHLYAIDAKSGRVQWKFDAGSQIVSSPAVTRDAVFFGTSAGEVVSVSRKDKKLRWKFMTGGPVPSSPQVVDNVVYIGSTDHHVYALPA